MTLYLPPTLGRWTPPLPSDDAARDRLRDLDVPRIDLRSHEPPRNSGEGDAVNGPTPLAGGDESHTAGA